MKLTALIVTTCCALAACGTVPQDRTDKTRVVLVAAESVQTQVPDEPEKQTKLEEPCVEQTVKLFQYGDKLGSSVHCKRWYFGPSREQYTRFLIQNRGR